MEHEVWREVEIEESEYRYSVSSLGRIKRLATRSRYFNRGCWRHRDLPERVLKQQINFNGYAIVSVQLGPGTRNKKTVSVAPLVCTAFNGPRRPVARHTAHLNGVRTDNRPENLKWASPAENRSHKILHGTQQRGESHPLTTITEDDVRRIREVAAIGPRGTKVMLAREYGLSKTTIGYICNYRTWGHVEA